MNSEKYSELKGTHAFLSPSKPSWLNYDEEKLATVYRNFLAVARGTRLHALAAELIDIGQKLPSTRKTLNMYVNDAIGYGMSPEKVLYFSDNCYGTADAISFRDGKLRIHDLKTGVTPAHIEQLKIYAALFCLDNMLIPGDLDMELRLYQSNDILKERVETEDIVRIMDKIVTSDKIIESIKREEK